MIIILSAAAAYGIVYSIIVITKKDKSGRKKTPSNVTESMQMQLQAYERLTLLVERIALPNVISRVGKQNMTAREMQHLLTQSIREEFDYNITQQVYVSADAWTAVKNLKEQNMLIVNQLANTLPPNATGLDLNKLLLQFLMNDKKGNLHELVSEVLSYEAKKVLNPDR
ncbi:MAG TPA: hypothetical protein VHB48_15450 [Chitinophagaceae bacterium]|jgi:hypothetical protein|nr:hypothetical protein [Chitinophagaceae bacterium]